MSTELETGHRDTDEIQTIAVEIGDSLQVAFDVLIRRREAAFTAAAAPLDAEKESLNAEHVALAKDLLDKQELLPSKARVSQAEYDRLLLAGDREGAAARLAEQKEAEGYPTATIGRQRQISARIEAIEAEKQAAARRIFRTWHSDCQAIIRPVEHGLFVVILDGLRQSFFDFQNETNTVGDGVLNTLFRLGDITDLTADERSLEWASGNRWYGGRVR